MSFEIKPLASDLKEDYLSFFESIEFTEHPHWADCYCYSFHFTGRAEEWLRDKNRSCVSDLIDRGRMKGYLVYHKGRVVGWCNANNRLNFQLLNQSYKLLDPEHPKICSIVCFLVHQDFRRQGIMQQLLERIVADYSSLQYEFIEVYPRSEEGSTETLYRGPLDFYTRNGFERVREGKNLHTLRLRL